MIDTSHAKGGGKDFVLPQADFMAFSFDVWTMKYARGPCCYLQYLCTLLLSCQFLLPERNPKSKTFTCTLKNSLKHVLHIQNNVQQFLHYMLVPRISLLSKAVFSLFGADDRLRNRTCSSKGYDQRRTWLWLF